MKEDLCLRKKLVLRWEGVSKIAATLGCTRQRLTMWLNGNRDAALETRIKAAGITVVGRSALIKEEPPTTIRRAKEGFSKAGSGDFPFCRQVARELGITPAHVHRVAKGERYSPRLKAHYEKRRAELEAK